MLEPWLVMLDKMSPSHFDSLDRRYDSMCQYKVDPMQQLAHVHQHHCTGTNEKQKVEKQ